MQSYGGNKRVKFQKLWLAELAWFDAGQHSPVGSQHGFVDVSLRLRKLAIGWKRARDVRRVAVILSAHIKQAVATEAHKCTYDMYLLPSHVHERIRTFIRWVVIDDRATPHISSFLRINQ